MKYECRKMAKERGYLEGIYIPPNRRGVGEECICMKKRNADGTVDEHAQLAIDLN
jgi:hypothetical protein